MLNEKYSPIKEAKHKEEHSVEEEKPEASAGGDDDYSSVENSESTLKHKYSNPATGLGIAGSGSKRLQPGLEDSMASSSLMMSSAGKDTSSNLKGRITGGGKTHIQVGALNYSAAKDSKQLEASSNLNETEEDDSESMSVSVSQSGANGVTAQWNKLREKYLGQGAAKDDDDDDSDDDDDDDDGFSDSAL